MGQMREHKMSRRLHPIALISVAACLAGCASTERNNNPQAARDRTPNPFVDAKEMETPAILPQTHFAAGRLFEEQNLTDKAIEQYRKAIAVGHQYVPAYHRLALLLSKTKRHKEAVEILTRATIVKPGNAVLHNNLGFEYAFLRDWPKAEREIRRAIKLNPDFARAHVNLGMVLARNGQFDEAFASFNQALPESDAYYNLGLMFRAQQRYEDAAWAFHRAVDRDMQFTAAKKQLEQLAPKLAMMGIPDTKYARVQWFRPDPAAVIPRDASNFVSATTDTNLFSDDHPSSEAAHGFGRPDNDRIVSSNDPSQAAFRFEDAAAANSRAVARRNNTNRNQRNARQFARGSFQGRHTSEAAFNPPSLPTDRVTSNVPKRHFSSEAAFTAPAGGTRHAGANQPSRHHPSEAAFNVPGNQSRQTRQGTTRGRHPSEAAFGRPGAGSARTMASTVVNNQPSVRIHRDSEAKFAAPIGRNANANVTQSTRRFMSSTIVPEFQNKKAKIRAQEERLRKIRNRLRELEREFGTDPNYDD